MGYNYSREHRFVGATYIDLPPNRARQAAHRETMRVPADTKVLILEVVCMQCRRPFDDVDGQPCSAAVPETRDHLVGGPSGSSATGERMKRKARGHPYHDCVAAGCSLPGAAAGSAG
jgi:hypothetical protein